MPKYLCDYCDVHLNFDSQSGRKQHNRGRKHQENVRGYYAQYAAALAQANRDAMAQGSAPVTGGLTLLPPSQSAGASLRQNNTPSFAPSFPQQPPPGQPFGIRTLGPPVGGMGPGGMGMGPMGHPPPGGIRMLGPPQQGFPPYGGPPNMGPGGFQQGGFRGPPPHMGGGGPGGLPPPPFGQQGLPMPPAAAGGQQGRPGPGTGPGGLPAPPPAGAPMQQPQAGGPNAGLVAPPAPTAPGGAPKPFVNPDRMRALGLQAHQ